MIGISILNTRSGTPGYLARPVIAQRLSTNQIFSLRPLPCRRRVGLWRIAAVNLTRGS